MTYRDDLDAAHARIKSLEAQVESLSTKAEPEPAKSRSKAKTKGHRQILSTTYYHRPDTYFPHFRIIYRGIRAGIPWIPRPETDSLLWLLAHRVYAPVGWALGNALLYALAFPYLSLLFFVATPVVVLGLFLSGLRVGQAHSSTKPRAIWSNIDEDPAMIMLAIAVTLGGAIGPPVVMGLLDALDAL